MALQVSNALIVALGGVGYQMAKKFATQLETRHAEMVFPTIRILPILEETAQQAATRSLTSLGVAVRPNDPQLRRIAEHLFPQRKFPDSQTEMARLLSTFARPRGQIALHHHIYSITERIREARREMFNTSSIDALSMQNMSVANDRRIQVYVLASLADAFMSGMIVDIAYILQHVIKEAAPEDMFVNINMVLAMPGFKGDVRERPGGGPVRDLARLRMEAQTDVNASATAALREIDYYLSHTHAYSRQFSKYLDITTPHNPLGEGRLYVLEPTNEQEKTIDDVNALTSMVAEWLYHVTCTSLREQFDTPQILEPGKSYSSFGYSSLSVPIGKWIERVRIRQEIDLLSEMLSADSVEEKIDIATARSQLHITDRELKDALTDKTQYNDLRLQAVSFRNVPLAWSQQFLARVQSRYSDLMTKSLPETRGDIHYRKRQLASKKGELDFNLVDGLEKYVLNLLDDPQGGIIKAHMFLEALRDDLRADRERMKGNYTDKRGSAEKMGKRVEQARQRYVGRAGVAAGVGSIPFVWLGLMLLLGAIALVTLVIQWSQAGVGVVNWVGLVALLGVTGVVFGRTFNTLRTSRYQVVKTYDDRLQVFRETDLQEAAIQLYDDLIQWTGNIRQTVNDVWQSLIDIRTELNSDWNEVQDPDYLTGLSPERTSEYLLTPAAINVFERKIPTRNFGEQSEALRQAVGTPSQWIQDAIAPDELKGKLATYARNRVARVLEGYDLRQAIKNVPEGELYSKFNRVHQLSYPYWRHDPTKTALMEEPWMVVASAETGLDMNRLFGADLQKFTIDDPYEIAVSGVRHGFSLSEMNVFTQIMSRAYDRAIFRGQEMLHTTHERLALPNPEEPTPEDVVIKNMPLRQLYPVARALDVVHLGEVAGKTGLEVSYTDKKGREILIGENPVDAVFQLERDYRLQQAIRSDVSSAWEFETSLAKVKAWMEGVDERQPEHWAKLAAMDFVNSVDETSLLV